MWLLAQYLHELQGFWIILIWDFLISEKNQSRIVMSNRTKKITLSNRALTHQTGRMEKSKPSEWISPTWHLINTPYGLYGLFWKSFMLQIHKITLFLQENVNLSHRISISNKNKHFTQMLGGVTWYPGEIHYPQCLWNTEKYNVNQ